MTLASHTREAIANLRSTRVRTGLTILGIIIGVLSITLVLALGEGSKRTITTQVTQLDAGIIMTKPGGNDQSSALAAYAPFSTLAASTLTERDVQAITNLDNIASLAPIMFINGTVTHNDKRPKGIPIIATTPDFLDLLKLKMASGQFITPTTNRDTVVLGHAAAISLIGTDQARGQEIKLKGRSHTVIGVLKNTQAPINAIGINVDKSVIISLEDGKSFNQGIAQISELIIRADDPATVAATAAAVDAAIIANHEGERDFSVIEGKDAAAGIDASYSLVVFITTAVAAVALIVGGIGIMNIMLVSVTERTREIGIRKALGASNGHILTQFLIESLTMTVSGGVIGLIAAYIIAFFIGVTFSFQPALTWEIVAAAMSLAVGVGVVFGLYPAIKASRKDPIDALRQYE